MAKKQKNERSSKSKVITVLLGVSLFCMFSLFLLSIFNREWLTGIVNRSNKGNNDNSSLTIYEYSYLNEEGFYIDYENTSYYSDELRNNMKMLNKYNYSCSTSECILLAGGYNYLAIGENKEVYIYNVLTKKKVKTSITYEKEIDYYKYIINNEEFHIIELLADSIDGRIWLSNDSKKIVYNFNDNKVFKEMKYEGPLYYSPIRTKTSYLYIQVDNADDVTYYGKIYNKNLEEIIDLKNYYYELDGVIDDDFYIHTTENYKEDGVKVVFYKISANGKTEILKDFGKKDVLALNYSDYSYVIVENNKAIMKDKNDKEIQIIGNIPQPKDNLGYEYVSKKASIAKNENGETIIRVRFGCENGFETGYYTKIYTYNVTKNVISEKDLYKIGE